MKIDSKLFKNISFIFTLLLVFGISFAFAYFQGQIGTGATANVTVQTKTTDDLSFSVGNDIELVASQSNFGSGAGNRTGSTTATASLKANNNTNSATQTYNVYLYININNYVYTTSPTNTPELLLTVTNPSNQAVTSISGLTYTTVNGVSGFDITTKTGLIQLASNYSISSSSSTTPTTHTWNMTVTFVNLDSDQQANTGKLLNAKAVIQKNTITTYYWNDEFDGSYVYSYPLGQRRAYTGTVWANGYPDYYLTLASLRSATDDIIFASSPFYIKTVNEHLACLYYNEHEFCLGTNYWQGPLDEYESVTGLAAKNKLQMEMEAALGTSATLCQYDSIVKQVYCSFDDFICEVDRYGDSYCYSRETWYYCRTYHTGYAACFIDD